MPAPKLPNLPTSLRLVVIAPGMAAADAADGVALALIERSRQLRIGLLENGYNLIAVLLSDRIVMMTNGPSAMIGEILSVELHRPRGRVAVAESTQYLGYRKAVIDFLYTRQPHVEKLSA